MCQKQNNNFLGTVGFRPMVYLQEYDPEKEVMRCFITVIPKPNYIFDRLVKCEQASNQSKNTCEGFKDGFHRTYYELNFKVQEGAKQPPYYVSYEFPVKYVGGKPECGFLQVTVTADEQPKVKETTIITYQDADDPGGPDEA